MTAEERKLVNDAVARLVRANAIGESVLSWYLAQVWREMKMKVDDVQRFTEPYQEVVRQCAVMRQKLAVLVGERVL